MDCLHPETQPCRYIKSNNVTVVVKQCQTCGRNLGEMPKAAHDLSRLPDWDIFIQYAWDEKCKAEFDRKREVESEQQNNKEGEWWKKYQVYLHSPHWFAVRSVVKRRDVLCQCCLSNRSEQAHHLSYATYNKFGFTFPAECVGICGSCHEKIHSEEGGGNGHQ